MATPALEARVLDASDEHKHTATAQPFASSAGTSEYGLHAHAVFRCRSRCRFQYAGPIHTLQFAPMLVNEALLNSTDGGPSRAAASFATILAGTLDTETRFELGLADPGGFEPGSVKSGAPRTGREVAAILDAVDARSDGAPPADNEDVGFKARVAEEMERWHDVLAKRVHRHAAGEVLPPASVAAAGLAVACAWAASMRGHPASLHGAAAKHWRECGEASAFFVAEGAFGALEEPTAQLDAAWAEYGFAQGCARACFREVSRVVAAALAPVFAEGVELCGAATVLGAAARAAALVVATSEYLAVRIEPMLVMFAVPRIAQKRKRTADSHATLPATDSVVMDVLEMCNSLAKHSERNDVVEWANAARQALEPCVRQYMPHVSAGRDGVPFERQALSNLCAAILANPRLPSSDPLLAKWRPLACRTVTRLRLVRPPTNEEEQRSTPRQRLDARREARLVASATSHRALAERPDLQAPWVDALGASWRVLFHRHAGAKAAVAKLDVGTEGEDSQAAALRVRARDAAHGDAITAAHGNESATRMWSVANVAYATMRYNTFGEPPFALAAAPLDARVVVCQNGEQERRMEKRMATWVTAYPMSLA